jgi:hypothetical protein
MYSGLISPAARDLSRQITANGLALIGGASGVILRLAPAKPDGAAWGALRDVATW